MFLCGFGVITDIIKCRRYVKLLSLWVKNPDFLCVFILPGNKETEKNETADVRKCTQIGIAA